SAPREVLGGLQELFSPLSPQGVEISLPPILPRSGSDYDITSLTPPEKTPPVSAEKPERIVERTARVERKEIITPADTSSLRSDLLSQVSLLNKSMKDSLEVNINDLRALFSRVSAKSDSNSRIITLTQRIDQLDGTTLKNIKLEGVSGITDGDIPNTITASNYLPLSGGTVTGSLTLQGLTTISGGVLTNTSTSTITNLTTVLSTSTQATSTYLSVTTHASTSQLLVSTGLGVGISTSTTGSLEVTGSALFGDSIDDIFNLNSGYLSFANRATTSILSSNADSFAIATTSSSIPLLKFDTLNTRIGIGTTTPAEFLSIASTTYIAGALGVGRTATSSGTIVASSIINILGSGTSTFTNGIKLTSGCILGADNTCVGGTAAGSDSQVQYNNGGSSFGG
ncbi:MAG: hypothetical protein AAB635_02025, partial [Patescibacteria group bacterium]